MLGIFYLKTGTSDFVRIFVLVGVLQAIKAKKGLEKGCG